MTVPAHKVVIDRCLNWDLVKERLGRYENIGRYYPLNHLQDCSNKAPFYCHYLSWRLGIWKDEQLFSFFDNLLADASKMPIWSKNKIPGGCEFQNFLTFLWELQVAKLFADHPETNVEWTRSGPDLRVQSKSGVFYVECTTHPQSYGLEEFINELLGQIDYRIKAKHRLFIEFSLPNNAIEPFLSELFAPLLDDIFLQEKIEESKRISPIRLSVPKSGQNLYLFIENESAGETDPNQPWNQTGAPEETLDSIVEKVVQKKRRSNNLKSQRPNMLAANLLLGDFQTGRALRNVPAPDLGTEFNAVFLTACGIDEIPSLNNGLIHFYDNHPIRDFLNL
jgi:hypothetical protein